MSEWAFCEPVWVTGPDPWHIRRVGKGGLKLSGGADAPLCFAGRDWINGWDLDVDITPEHLEHACPRCVARYKQAVSGGPDDE